MFDPKTLDRTIAPMLLMNVISGIGVFKDSNSRLMKCFELIYSGCYIPILFYTCKYSIEFSDNLYFLNILFLNRMLLTAGFAITGTLLAVLIVAGRFNARKIRNLIAQFDKYDRAMEKMGLPRQYCMMHRYQLYNFAVCKLLLFTSAMILYKKYIPPMLPLHKAIFIVLALHFPFLLTSVCVISVCFWVRCLELRFQQLNNLLQSIEIAKPNLLQEKNILTMFYDFDNNRFSSFEEENIQRSKGNVLTIRLIKQAHLELIKIAGFTNSTYGVQLFAITVSAIAFLIGNIYAIYRILWLDLTFENTILHITPALFLICFPGLQIFAVGHTCARTSAEATLTGNVICRLYNPCTSKEFRAEIRDFTLQLVQNRLKFTIYGFLKVDHSYIFRIMGSIITFLVIIIQVGDITVKSYRKFLEMNHTIENDAPIHCSDFNMNCTFKGNWY